MRTMAKRMLLRRIACAVAAVLAAGCATTQSRLEKYANVFAGFPSEVQENVRKGGIELGYTRDMVFIALGDPSRIFYRQTDRTETEIWSYTDVDYQMEYRAVPRYYWYRDREGHLHSVAGTEWVNLQRPYELEIGSVEFVDGKVTAIERLRP